MSYKNYQFPGALTISFVSFPHEVIRHIHPLMFDVIGDKPEGVARGVYRV